MNTTKKLLKKIGGNDIGAIVGCDMHNKDVFDVADRITTKTKKEKELTPPPAIDMGNILEPLIIDEMAKEYGVEIQKPKKKKNNPDGIFTTNYKRDMLLECKATTAFNKYVLDGNGELKDCPFSTHYQIQHYLSKYKDVDYCILAVAFVKLGNNFEDAGVYGYVKDTEIIKKGGYTFFIKKLYIKKHPTIQENLEFIKNDFVDRINNNKYKFKFVGGNYANNIGNVDKANQHLKDYINALKKYNTINYIDNITEYNIKNAVFVANHIKLVSPETITKLLNSDTRWIPLFINQINSYVSWQLGELNNEVKKDALFKEALNPTKIENVLEF